MVDEIENRHDGCRQGRRKGIKQDKMIDKIEEKKITTKTMQQYILIFESIQDI